MVTRPLIAFYGNTIDRYLGSFKNPKLHINGIALHIDLYRIYVKEKITIILIKGADIISPLGIIVQPFVHLFLVVDLAFHYPLGFTQYLIIIDIISGEGDVPIIILLPFFYVQFDVYGVGVKRKHRIP